VKSEFFLEMTVVELATRLQNDLIQLENSDDTKAALEDAYKKAFEIGAIITLLSLLGYRFTAPHAIPRALNPNDARSFTTSATTALEARGITFTLENPQFIQMLEQQALAANLALEGARVSERFAIGAETRAAGYAARWATQHGANHAVIKSKIVTPAGTLGQALKTWVRTFPRQEHRGWHDLLEGVSIPVDQRFQLRSPKYGLLEVLFPYDGTAPWGEWIHCGHGVRYETPDGSTVTPWLGI
jgi:hypothetical protein